MTRFSTATAIAALIALSACGRATPPGADAGAADDQVVGKTSVADEIPGNADMPERK